MMKEKWPGLWGFSSSRRCSCEVLKGESGKSILELIPIGIVRHTKKPCKTAVDLMKTDMESCAESDKKLESAGIKKPMRDIYKDDCCYGCSFAIETKDENMGPFDRRYKCNGFSRILNPIATAYQLVKNVSGFKIERDYDQKSKTWSMKWEEALEGLLKAQQVLLVAASIIGERANGKPIDCVDSKEKPLCYYGGSLEDFLTK